MMSLEREDKKFKLHREQGRASGGTQRARSCGQIHGPGRGSYKLHFAFEL